MPKFNNWQSINACRESGEYISLVVSTWAVCIMTIQSRLSIDLTCKRVPFNARGNDSCKEHLHVRCTLAKCRRAKSGRSMFSMLDRAS
eukprot:12870772-Heterocapsa_arctica.AAC.1